MLLPKILLLLLLSDGIKLLLVLTNSALAVVRAPFMGVASSALHMKGEVSSSNPAFRSKKA